MLSMNKKILILGRQLFHCYDVNELDVNNDPNTLLPEPSTITDSQTTIPMSIIQQPAEIQDDAFISVVRSLNAKQRIAYDIVLGWSRKKVKSLSSTKPLKVYPL